MLINASRRSVARLGARLLARCIEEISKRAQAWEELTEEHRQPQTRGNTRLCTENSVPRNHIGEPFLQAQIWL